MSKLLPKTRHFEWTLLWLAAALPSGAAAFTESFSTDPAARGWRATGERSLFHWNRTNQHLEVTWDSSRTNSLFHRPLGTVLTKAEDFNFSFDLWLRDIAIGVDPAKPYTFQIAIGLCRFANITNAAFFRGAGINATYGPRNLVEFDYFPDSGFGATVAPTVVSTNNRIRFSDNHPLELTTHTLFRVELTYRASNQVLRTFMTRNGTNSLPIHDLSLAGFPDFRVDTFAVISYSDAGQSPPQFAGSILAHGFVDNIAWTVPNLSNLALRASKAAGGFGVEVNASSNWTYRLETTRDMRAWSVVGAQTALTNGPLTFHATNFVQTALYRVVADRP